MKGKIESTSAKGDYSIILESIVINVQYENWFSSTEAKTNIKGVNYTIKSNSIWQNEFLLYREDEEIGKISFNWKGNAIIGINNENFILKFKGVLNRRFELENKDGELELVIIPNLKWSKIKYEYDFKLTENNNRDNINEIITLVSYAANISTNYYWNA